MKIDTALSHIAYKSPSIALTHEIKISSVFFNRNHCQKSSLSRISNRSQAGIEPAQNLSSGLVEQSYAIVITTTPRRHYDCRTVSQPDTSPTDTSPTDISPKWQFPDRTLPRRTFPRNDNSPTGHFPEGHFSEWTFPH